MRWCVCLFVLALVSVVSPQTLQRETCDASRSEVDVDVASAGALIGGIFMMRNPLMGGYTCGTPHKELIQVYEAAKFAIQRVNAQNIVPGIRLGMKAYDYCGSPYMAVRAAQKFYPQFSNTQLSCSDGTKLHLGILGPLSTVSVAEMTSEIPASQVSPRIFHPDLSDKSTYPYFLRTGRNWFSLAKVLAQVLKQMNWTRVTVVYVDSEMGRMGYERFLQQALADNICVAGVKMIPAMATQTNYESNLADLGNDGVKVAVFLGSGTDAETLLKSNVGKRVQWVMADMLRMMSSNPPNTYLPNSRGVIFALPKAREINEFENYFVSLSENNPPADNPWFSDWYMTLYDCRLPGVNYEPFASKTFCSQTISKRSIYIQLPYVQTTIEGVYAYAKALRTAQRTRCGDSFVGACDSLRAMTTAEFHNILKNTDFTFSATDGIPSLVGHRVRFDANGDIMNQDFTVYNYNNKVSSNFAFEEVGTYENNILSFDKLKIQMYDTSGAIMDVISSCPAEGCRYCVVPPDSMKFYFNSGDINIGVALSAHSAGRERYSCGEVNPYGMAQAIAIQYAVENLNIDLPGILNGVRLGAVMLDACNNPDIASRFYNNLLGSREVVQDKHGRVVDPNSVKAIIDGLTNSGAMSFSKATEMYELPQIGTVASSALLMDHTNYPLYSRTMESNYYQSIAMANFFVRKGWYYVQAVYSPSMRQDIDMLKTTIADFKICMSAEYEMGTAGSANQILDKVRSNSNARVVVMFLEKGHIREILLAIKEASWAQNFVIVGGESWGSDNLNILGLEDVVNGMVTFQPLIGPRSNFQNWINQKQPRTSMNLPWFRELYENAFQCYVDASSKEQFTNECPNPGAGLSSSPLYQFFYQMTTSMNAVYVTAKALDETLKHYCGINYSGVCVEYRAANNSNKILLQNIRNANISLSSSYQLSMLNGEAHTGVEIMNYRLGQKFVQVGLYNSISGALTMLDNTLAYPSSIQPLSFASYCPGNCAECSYLTKTKYTYVPGDITIGGVFGLHDFNRLYPTLCGDIRVDYGVQFGLAMQYAIHAVNNKTAPVSLNGIKLGGLTLDHCSIAGRPWELMSYVYTHTGLLSPADRMKLDTSNILGWITDNTAAVESAAMVTNGVDIPLVSPLASSAAFQDQEKYPSFFRTIQGDVTISVAISKLAKSLSYNYVNVIYSSDSFGRGGVETFESVAAQEEICILQKYMVSPSLNASQILRLISLSTSQVVVLWTNGADTASLFNAKNISSGAYRNFVLISSMPYMGLAKMYGTSAFQSFFLNIKTQNDPGYLSFLGALSSDDIIQNSFLYEYYTKLHSCNLPGTNFYNTQCLPPYRITAASAFAQDNYVVPTINAVYALVGAMDAVLKEKCGHDYEGICAEYSQTPNIHQVIMDKMGRITFRDPIGNNFEFIDREGNMGMDVLYLYNGLSTVGEFAGASLHLKEGTFTRPNVSTSCPAPCQQCIQKKIEFTYIPGDILIGGLFDVHENSLVPFSCGDLNIQGGFQLLEAFNYAIGKVNDKSGAFKNVLKNIKLGGIGLDACQSSIRMGYLVSDVHNGIIKLTRNGITVNPDDISMYVGGGSSDSSLYLARLLKSLKIPQISYMSSSDSLSDQDRYPYFMRTVPADDKQSLAMIKFLNANNIKYVQIAHSPNDYGKMGAEKFKTLAAENKICVAQTIGFPDNSSVTQESADKVVRSLLEKPVANTVVVYADAKYIHEMLKAMTRNAGASGKFRFIGSETWGNNYEVISGVEYLAKGSVTLNLESSDIRDFDTHIGQKSPGNYPENPWFPEFYEEMVNCYLTVATSKHKTPCLPQTVNIAAQRDYIQDPGILHVINAVFSAAYGLDNVLKSQCGMNYTTICEQFKNTQNRHKLLLDNVLQSSFVDPSGSVFNFRTDRRDGNKGYILYDIKERMTMNELGYTYEKIGTFSSQDVLSLDAGYKANWDGSCERQGSCSECPTVRNLLQRYMLQPAKDQATNGATLLAVLPIHSQGTDPYLCGHLDINAFYNALAFIYTLEKYFPETKYKLRGLIVDSCSNNLRVDQDLYSLFSKGRLCNTAFSFDGFINNNTLAGVITSTTNHVIAANRVLSPLKVPILSSSATSTMLSDTEKYPYFARTVPPDNMQVEVILRILKERNWDSVSVIYSTDSYGRVLHNYFVSSAEASQTCAGAQISIPSPATMDQAKDAIRYLESESKSNVVVLMSSNPRLILQAAKELNVLGKYLWIGTDIWGTSVEVVQGMEEDVLGSITIEMRSSPVEDFKKYVAELSYSNRKGIPNDWFEEFYQMFHKCNIKTAKVNFPQYADCTTQETIDVTQILSQPFVLNTIAATYAYAKAIEQVSNGVNCNFKASFQECFRDETTWKSLFSSILNVDWSLSLSQTYVLRFTNSRFWNVGYNINSFIKSAGIPQYRNIGSLNGQTLQFSSEYNNYKGDNWLSCRNTAVCDCSAPVISAQTSNDTIRRTKAAEPRNFLFYNVMNTTINNQFVPIYDLTYKWPIWAIAVAVPTCVGLFVTIFLFFYLLIFYEQKGGTTLLGFMAMIGIMGIYALNFAFFLPAATDTCGARQFCLGVVYAIVFAALLVKAVDNWRVDAGSTGEYEGITNKLVLLLIALGIVCVQLIIPIQWLVHRPPSASKMNEATEIHDWMMCDPHDMYDKALAMSMIFVMFLVLLTGIFSGMAWLSPFNSYESRWILVSSICTAGCFMVWMIVITNASPPYRDGAVALGNLFNATAILIFTIIRKVVLMLMPYDENDEKQPSISDDRGNEVYSTVFSNAGYDNDDAVFQPSSPRQSELDNGDVGF